jgi:diguanylate cyclase (GGDEF)-like protein
MSDDVDLDLSQPGVHIIDLADQREPTLLEVARSPAVRRAAARALHELESHHDHAPWIAICTSTSELIAASPSFDPGDRPAWTARVDDGLRLALDDAPLAVLGLGVPSDISQDHPAVVAARWVVRALAEIVLAEQRAAIANVRAGRAEALAATDALTGLANQRAWWDRIAEEDARIERSEGHDVIAVVDLDGLKTVNDDRGHLHGDLLLRLTAVTLCNAVRSCDVLARVGGDEFAVLAVDYDGEPSALGERISSALAEAGIQASVGIASPSAGTSLIDAYDRADRAMYAHKRNRRRNASAEA